ncbi:MAG: oligopeptide transport system substrate-binding protein [Hyphomonadaceae bacterium]|nr:MAG: oligopeptide transport system substrate-binding protein [Hyphomonadaceae bacterium]KAF0185988.1 MAG: oligopeptide transport system substrate-binding protein [Hyphomonadaceae bacterium]
MAGSTRSFVKRSILVSSFAFIFATGLTACSDKADHEGTRILHIGNVGEPFSLDPHQASGTWENRILGDMFMGLVTDNAAGEPIPGMATSWTTSADGLVWTFKLRDAKWSDGHAVSAHDFVYAWQRLFSNRPPAKYASLLFLLKNSEDIFNGRKPAAELGARAIDDKTLEVTLTNPAPYLPGLMTHYTSFPIPKHVVEKLGNEWIKPANIVVNGAFKLTEWSANDFVHVVKNPEFFDAANVCLNELYYYPTHDDTAAERRVKTGALDVQTNFSGSRRAQIDRTMPGYARVSPYIATTYYIFNTRKAPFDNPKVREALSLAVDREFITNEILKGGQQPAYSLVPPGIIDYESGKVAQSWRTLDRAQRLARARQLLAEAGYGPDKPLHFGYSYRNSGDNPRVAPVVQQNWRDIGPWVSVDLTGTDVQLHYEKLRQGDFEVGDAGWVADFNDARSFLYNFFTQAGQMNYGKYSNPAYDTLVNQSDQERNAERRTALMLDAERVAIEDDAIAPIYFYTNRNLVNPRVTGWVDNANDYHRSRFLCTREAQTTTK